LYLFVYEEVVLLITPSTPYEHLLIRSGRIVSVLSFSVKFVVKLTKKPMSTTECLAAGDCVVACDLNITLPLSLALNINSEKVVGLLQSLSIYSVDVFFH
jgi:heterodisulfide reductase subunit A-like polyferredoxin